MGRKLRSMRAIGSLDDIHWRTIAWLKWKVHWDKRSSRSRTDGHAYSIPPALTSSAQKWVTSGEKGALLLASQTGSFSAWGNSVLTVWTR